MGAPSLVVCPKQEPRVRILLLCMKATTQQEGDSSNESTRSNNCLKAINQTIGEPKNNYLTKVDLPLDI